MPSEASTSPGTETLQKYWKGGVNQATSLMNLRSKESNGSLNATLSDISATRSMPNDSNGANGTKGTIGTNGTEATNGKKATNGTNGTPDPSKTFTKQELRDRLTTFIDDSPELRGETRPGLKELFFKDGITDKMVDAAVKMGDALCALGCGKEIATDLTLLTLYDVVLLVDDSGSMKTEEGGKRIETLKIALKYLRPVINLSRKEGIKAVRFLNSKKVYLDVNKKRTIHEIFENHPFRHWSRIGTELKNKVINKHVFGSEMKRPLLVITITDGDAEGESKNLLVSVIHECIEKLRGLHKEKTEHGADAIGFQFAKVGNDQGAERLLKRLDDDLKVGEYVDCFPMGLEVFEDTDAIWPAMPKLLLGGISSWWDHMENHAEKPTTELEDGVGSDDDSEEIHRTVEDGEESDDDDIWPPH